MIATIAMHTVASHGPSSTSQPRVIRSLRKANSGWASDAPRLMAVSSRLAVVSCRSKRCWKTSISGVTMAATASTHPWPRLKSVNRNLSNMDSLPRRGRIIPRAPPFRKPTGLAASPLLAHARRRARFSPTRASRIGRRRSLLPGANGRCPARRGRPLTWPGQAVTGVYPHVRIRRCLSVNSEWDLATMDPAAHVDTPVPSTSTRSQAVRHVVTLTLLAGATLVLGLDRMDLWGIREARVLLPAREMLASGDWTAPRIGGRLRLEKPPLPYWQVALIGRVTGEVGLWETRLPGAIQGVLLVLPLLRVRPAPVRASGRVCGSLCAFVYFSVRGRVPAGVARPVADVLLERGRRGRLGRVAHDRPARGLGSAGRLIRGHGPGPADQGGRWSPSRVSCRWASGSCGRGAGRASGA